MKKCHQMVRINFSTLRVGGYFDTKHFKKILLRERTSQGIYYFNKRGYNFVLSSSNYYSLHKNNVGGKELQTQQ